jgi:hypothetical protein
MKNCVSFVLVVVILLLPVISVADAEPDEPNFNIAREIANFMETHYGITILIGPECAGVNGEGFALGEKPAGRTPFLSLLGQANYESEIQMIDDAFSYYPPDFFELFGCSEAPNGLRILLANQVVAEGETVAGVSSIGDGYYNIFLGIGAFNELNIHHEIWHVMEFRITLEEPDAFDNWNQLNPEGFTYSDEYFKQSIWEQTDPEDEWFVRGYSGVNAEEDRATVIEAIFMYNEDWWSAHPNIAKKLDVLLETIQPIFGDVYFHE